MVKGEPPINLRLVFLLVLQVVLAALVVTKLHATTAEKTPVKVFLEVPADATFRPITEVKEWQLAGSLIAYRQLVPGAGQDEGTTALSQFPVSRTGTNLQLFKMDLLPEPHKNQLSGEARLMMKWDAGEEYISVPGSAWNVTARDVPAQPPAS